MQLKVVLNGDIVEFTSLDHYYEDCSATVDRRWTFGQPFSVGNVEIIPLFGYGRYYKDKFVARIRLADFTRSGKRFEYQHRAPQVVEVTCLACVVLSPPPPEGYGNWLERMFLGVRTILPEMGRWYWVGGF